MAPPDRPTSHVPGGRFRCPLCACPPPAPSPPPSPGDTIYNLSRYNELEVDDSDRPLFPPMIKRAEVLWNPFDDLQPRVDR